MMMDLPLESSTSVVLESAMSSSIFGTSYQDEEQMQDAKKRKNMATLIVNEECAHEDVERMAREIQFFPQHQDHELHGNMSEFFVYERSSSYANGVDVELDLSLKLSSSNSAGSSTIIDLSLKLHNP
ncbi:hypothetical protein BS78_03G186900 [Paspalum vaginatum]|nr:hypothetical protein BS78_03G186900 [Paspalum vaginatum]